MLTIVKREFLDHFQSLQFTILFGMAIVLFIVNGLVFSVRHNNDLAWYSRNAPQNPSTAFTGLALRPNSLDFMSEGGDKYGISLLDLRPGSSLSLVLKEPRNFKMPVAPEMDWSFIVKILFSLYVILLGFDSISGEKEQGTLRLTLSHPLGRMRWLAAKYIALMSAVTVALVIGILVSLIIYQIIGPSILTSGNVARIFSMFFLALIYFSIYALLSLMISSILRESSSALLTLLMVWAVVSILIPNVSGILSEKLSNVPSEYETARQLRDIVHQNIDKKMNMIDDRVTRGELKTEADVKTEADIVWDEASRLLNKHYDYYHEITMKRTELARAISRASPAALFQYAAESIAETGPQKEKKIIQDAKLYSTVYDQYILKKVGKLVVGSGWGGGRSFQIAGKPFFYHSPRPEEYDGDVSDFPRFEGMRSSFASSIKEGIFDLAGLLIWNFILVVAAAVAFFKADVR